MDLSTWANVAQISSVVGGVIIGFWRIWRKIDQHQAKTDVRAAVVDERLDRIEKQFGPNGGGLREAVNRIGDAITRMDTKLDTVSVEVAQLKGEFKQHIREEGM